MAVLNRWIFTRASMLDALLSKKYPVTFHCRFSSTSEEEMKRRAKLMSKGLPKKKEIEGVKNVILIASGKGGVGKSTTAVNIACSLASHHNFKVGLLDADVFGPCLPLMMNLNDTPFINKDNKMIPLTNYGIKCMSMGFLVPDKSAIMWRGLMVMSALEKLTQKVEWGNLDYLVVDTPPGTGDTLLSLVQNLYVAGVIAVTTPHLSSIQITRRSASALKKMDVPILGIVGNMSSIHCPSCNSNISFQEATVKNLSKDLGVPILGEIPMDFDVSYGSDSGKPLVISQPDSVIGQIYSDITAKILEHFHIKEFKDNIHKF